jgi:hypothetical protein
MKRFLLLPSGALIYAISSRVPARPVFPGLMEALLPVVSVAWMGSIMMMQPY